MENPRWLADVVDAEGSGRVVSLFYVVGGITVEDIDLQEGQGVGVYSVGELDQIPVTPCVQRSIDRDLAPILDSLFGQM